MVINLIFHTENYVIQKMVILKLYFLLFVIN